MRRVLPTFAVLSLLAVLALLAGCGSSSTSSSSSSSAAKPAPASPPAASAGAGASSTAVTISNFKYAPDPVKVKVGGTIKFTNMDSAPHTATPDSGSAFDSGTLNQGKSSTVTFKTAGTFPYHCAFHAFMHGTVTVSAS